MKKLLFIIIAIIVIGFAALSFMTDSFGFKTAPIQDKKTLKNDKIEQIEIQHASSDVHVTSTSGKDITVEMKGKVSRKFKDQFKLEVTENGNTVKIAVIRDDGDWNPNIGINMVDVNLEVALPEKVYKAIDVDLVSGDMVVKNVKADEISLNTNSGDINAEDSISEKKFSIHTISGDMTLQDMKAENLQIDATSGDAYIRKAETKFVTLSSISGDIRLDHVTGDIEVRDMSGDIQISNDKLNGNIIVDSMSGDVGIQLNKNPLSLALNYDGISGEANVQLDGMLFEKKTEHSIKGEIGNGDYVVDVRTSSGDFTIQ
ncbi:DUF4097 family beta strand repeat-containing protein [Bacillus benzoevorans]|uniref:Lia operon protein LiaG n=1 Tax=Bacillus benzoevorans TaxID=1456 RepID=A0A7X0HQV6_9BACI|nr:DUF4097 family beta strand repeat-containing protein [Bacillus benzoevorans]MBB6445134.1 lia operon protein LiaG [Bacillus benzoevorans]